MYSDWSTTDAREPGERKILSILGIEYPFRYCPPGKYRMLCRQCDDGDKWDCEASFIATLTRGFWTLETEITQEMWLSVMGNNPSEYDVGPRRPVNSVSWNECADYVCRLNGRGFAPETLRFSLPTEAQWEYAMRAGEDGDHWKLKEIGGLYPNVGEAPNRWGLFSLTEFQAGEAIAAGKHSWYALDEWTADWYEDTPKWNENAPDGEWTALEEGWRTDYTATDPTGPAEGTERVTRNLGVCDNRRFMPCGGREGRAPDDPCGGVRLVLVSDR